MELLGHVLHPSLPSIEFKPVRPGRLWAAVQHLLRRRKVSGRAVEVIMGHFTYAFLLNRGLLSVFGATFKFIRSAYVEVEKLWPSVRSELSNAVALLPLAAVCLDRAWDSDVRATDAAPHGLGVCKSAWASRSVVEVGRVAKRWRYHMGAADTGNSEFCEEELPSSVSPDWQAVPARLMTEDR